MGSSFFKSVFLFTVMLFHGLVTQSAWAQYKFETIALLGDIAPGSGGTGADMPFTDFNGSAVLNAAGEVAFGADTSVNADGGDSGIFNTAGGALHGVAFEQQIAPGSGGSGADVPFIGFTEPTLNAAGEVAFSVLTSVNADGGQFGIYSTAGGTLQALAFQGQTAPGSGGSGADVPFFTFLAATPALNAVGEVAFAALTSANVDGGDQGIFSTASGALHSVAFQGQTAPGSGGSGADVPFNFVFITLAPAFNAAGEVAFVGNTSINADGGNQGIFSTAGGALHTVAFEEQIAPGSGGSGADVPFARFGDPVQNAAGEVAFQANTSDNVDFGDSGIFSNVGGTLHAVAFEGQTAPGSGGSGADVDFSSFSRSPTLNAAGEMAFAAFTSNNADGGNQGYFSTAGGALHTIAFEQRIAPGSGGSGADVPFADFDGLPVINAAGDVAFWAETLPNVDGGDSGIFSFRNGVLDVVVFEGDQIEVAPGDFRTIGDLFGGPSSQQFNDMGQIVIEATFTDGSEGIFVATAVPEPSAIALALVGIVGCCFWMSQVRLGRSCFLEVLR